METITFTDAEQPAAGHTVVVGMSGGVDSTLTALLLKERGCRVIGVTMSSWNHDLPLQESAAGLRNSCYGPDEAADIESCKKFCAGHGIEYHVIDVRDAYKKEVLDYFKAEYRAGRTPNPCIRCNPRVKFGALLDGVRAQGIDFDYFCTGHYARLVRPSQDISALYAQAAGQQPSPGNTPETKKPADTGLTHATGKTADASEKSPPLTPLMITHADDITKDQAYFLYRIPSGTLEKVRFPLGCEKKQDVFKMAKSRGLAAADRPESQDFIPPAYFDLLFADKPSVPGDIIDLDGRILGKHRGIEHYTIGQRRGLGVSSSRPLYVHSIDAARHTIILADNDDLLCAGLTAGDWVWAGNYAPAFPFRGEVKIRLASKPVPAYIEPTENGEYRITFDEPQRAVAPGQSAVVYLQGITMGGGIISRAIQ